MSSRSPDNAVCAREASARIGFCIGSLIPKRFNEVLAAPAQTSSDSGRYL